LLNEWMKGFPLKERAFETCCLHLWRLFKDLLLEDDELVMDTFILSWMECNSNVNLEFPRLKEQARNLLKTVKEAELKDQDTLKNKEETSTSPVKVVNKLKRMLSTTVHKKENNLMNETTSFAFSMEKNNKNHF